MRVSQSSPLGGPGPAIGSGMGYGKGASSREAGGKDSMEGWSPERKLGPAKRPSVVERGGAAEVDAEPPDTLEPIGWAGSAAPAWATAGATLPRGGAGTWPTTGGNGAAGLALAGPTDLDTDAGAWDKKAGNGGCGGPEGMVNEGGAGADGGAAAGGTQASPHLGSGPKSVLWDGRASS